MSGKFPRTISCGFVFILLGVCDSGASGVSFYPDQDFMRRAGVLECRKGVVFSSSVFPFEGKGDSLKLILSIQMENKDLIFTKSDDAMKSVLEFSLYLRNEKAGFVVSKSWAESLMVETKGEASASMKSVFQTEVTAPPGKCVLSDEITDKHAGRTGVIGPTEIILDTEEGTPSVYGPYPYYSKGGDGGVMVIEPRSRLDSLLFNPAKSYSYGREDVGFYVELHRMETGPLKPLTVKADIKFEDSEWREIDRKQNLILPGESSISISLRPEMLKVGEGLLKIELLDAEGSLIRSDSTFFFVSLTEEWILTEYRDVIRYLDHLLTPEEKRSFEAAEEGDRRRLWREFWKERDPIPSTPQNERLVEYFRRIQVADARFSTPILEGWKSDRGRVYILLGPPEEVYLRDVGQRLERYEIWVYDQSLGFQLVLYFVDRGFVGLYWLQNEGDLQQALSRLRSR